MDDGWNVVSKLREVDYRLSRLGYSYAYASSNHLLKNKYAEGGKPHIVWVHEPVEVALLNDELMCRYKTDIKRRERKEVFDTFIGQFVSHDHGEFGGELITPKEVMGGNFIDIFECDGVVYGIDSCNHMGIGHTNIYAFDEKANATHIFGTKGRDLFDDGIREHMAHRATYMTDDSVYILVSGECGISYPRNNGSWQDKTYLLVINKGELKEKMEFDFELGSVQNMIVYNNQLVVGLNKVAGIIDLSTKEIKAYTGLGKGAIKNLMSSRDKGGWD